MYCNNYFSSPHTHTSFVHTHYNTEMEREERSRRLPFRAERQSQEEMRRREELQQRVVEAERRAQEESRRADQAQQRAREMEGRVREMEGRVMEMEGRVREESERANRDVEQAAQHDLERTQVLQQQLHDAEVHLRAADFWVVQSDDVHLTDEEIGRGGWAVVKVAHFRGLRVAAKCLHEDLVYPYHRNIFQREMSFAAKLRHPNLLQFIGATVEPAMIILTEVMPTSLRALVNRTRLTNKQIVSIALDVARALNYLHLMRPHPILHRDLSSANVLLEPTPEDGWRAKVSDYGTANFSQYLRTENPGSPVYSAPEARNPDLQSAKMDIYSFGVLLIEMCTSEFPVPEMRPRLIPTIAHAQLVALIRSCLAPDRHQRPRCSVVIERLDAIEP